MKKDTYLLVFYLTTLLLVSATVSSFGQSLLITPERTLSDNTLGDNININSNSGIIGIQSLRYKGTAESKQAVGTGDYILRIGAGGYYAPTSFYLERAGIFFRATQDWNGSATGTKISFHTINNNNTNAVERMVIDQSGYIGMGNTFPTAKLHINHLSSGANPHLHLQSTGASSAVIMATSTDSGIWENHFLPGATAGTSLVYWYNVTFNNTPLTLTGEGDALVGRNASIGGYTSLGGGSAPKIKMKEFATTTSAASGGFVGVTHGLTQAKILSVSVLVTAVTGNDIPPGYASATYPTYQYFFFVNGSQVLIENSNGNHASIAGRPAKILITYKE
jgi:hypothetical protein